MNVAIDSRRRARRAANLLWVISCTWFLVATSSAWAGSGVTRLWVSRYNGPGNAGDNAVAAAANPNGSSLFVTGISEGRTSAEDYATISYDAATGEQLWARRYNGPGNGDDEASSMTISPDGSIVFVTGSSLGSSGFFDYATVAYDAATGDRLWTKRYNGAGTGGSGAASIVASLDGSTVYVSGHTATKSGATVFATVAYAAASGAQLWVGRAHGPGGGLDFPSSSVASSDGSKVFVTGTNIQAGGAYDYATVAFDAATGARLWARRYNGPAYGTDAAFSVAGSPDGSRLFVTGNSLNSNGNFDYATVAYDAQTGARLWVRRFNGRAGGNAEASAVEVTHDGSTVVVTGEGSGTSGFDYATVAYDAQTGARLWLSRYRGGGNGNSGARALAQSPDGTTVFVTGGSQGASTGEDYATVAYDTATGARIWVRRYSGRGAGNDEASSIVTSPDGSRVFVTGGSWGSGSSDFATVAYGL